MNSSKKPTLNYPVLRLISDYVHRHAVERPDHLAVVYQDQRLSYRDLAALVNQCAKALLASGVQLGDRVATLCTSRLEYWVTFLASAQVGAIWLGLNPKYRLPEMRYVIEDAQPSLMFAIAGFEQQDYSDSIAILQRDYQCIRQVVSLTDSLPGTLAFDAFLQSGNAIDDSALEQRQGQIQGMDAALLVYTSGSTGKPKGALLSHYGLCFGSAVQNTHINVTNPSTSCTFPINHVACVVDTCCVTLVAGGTLIFRERHDVAWLLETLGRERLTMVGGVPTMLLMLLEHPDFEQADFSSVELIAWGGAAMPVPLIERLQALAPRLLNVYGMTETAANTTFTSPDADLVELSETIGRPSPHMPCRIVNENGEPCGVGEPGELQFKGDYLLLEYLNKPDASREVYTEDGWLHTGDLGYWRDNGCISLVGRLSDMFKSGGYNVYPREIENLLESHPRIDMAAVVSIPDPRFQEVGAAYVVLSAGENEGPSNEQIRVFCRDNLANYKVPKTVTIVEQLPTLPVGKVDKVSLKQRAMEEVQ